MVVYALFFPGKVGKTTRNLDLFATTGKTGKSKPECTEQRFRLADCVNSSPPFIFRKSQGFSGIWAKSGKFGKFRETQGNSVEFNGVLYGTQYEFSGNSWGLSGRRRIFGKIWGLGWFRVIWGVKRLLRK